MDSSHARVKSLFQECVARPREQQQAYLDDECADAPAVRERVGELLSAYAEASSFLEHPVPRDRGHATATPLVAPLIDAASTVPDGSLAAGLESVGPGCTFGPYTIRERLGGGGMGEIWAAEQHAPVARLVALKLIKTGAFTPELVARFRFERQALAVMDHPHIARVFDAGDTPSGIPYLAMELVYGIAITAYCDARRATVRDRLELFVRVCQAIQHAHQKGVIHRDIKPSNVLVAEYDGRPVPKVIDFGVAKPIVGQVRDRPDGTSPGLIGTLEYMSPEQADGGRVGSDTRSDIYSLGVLLYELLTGRTPLGRPEAGQDLTEVLRRIREELPLAPSRRYGNLAAGATAAAESRGGRPDTLAGELRRELDWVVLRALEKDPARRYATVNDLAADLRHSLNDEPVTARPPSRVYRVQKFVRRNRVLAAATVAVTLALVGGIVGTSIGFAWAVSARAGEAAQRRQAEDNATRASEHEAAAKEAEANTAAAMEFLGDHVVAAARPKGLDGGLGRKVTMKEAIDAAAAELDAGRAVPDRPLVEASLREWLSRTYRVLDEPERALDHQRRAVALYERHRGPDHPDTLSAKLTSAVVFLALGRPKEAIAVLEPLLPAARTQFGEADHRTISAINSLAAAYMDTGRPDAAVDRFEEVVRLLRTAMPDDDHLLSAEKNLAHAYARVGAIAKSISLSESNLPKLRERLGVSSPTTLNAMHDLATNYRTVGRSADAAGLLEPVLRARQSDPGAAHPSALVAADHLVFAYLELGRTDEARVVFEARFRAEFPSAENVPLMATLLRADFHARLGEYAVAETLLRNASAEVGRTAPGGPQASVAQLLTGWVRLGQKHPDDAGPLLSAGIEGVRKHSREIPIPWRDRVLDIRKRVARLYDDSGSPESAEPWKRPFQQPSRAAR